MVDISRIEDPIMRLATETQIAHFGQCPRQLFQIPHPARDAKGRFGPRDGHLRRRFTPRSLNQSLSRLPTRGPETPRPRPLIGPNAPLAACPSPRLSGRRSGSAVAALRLGNGVCVAVDNTGVIDVLHWEFVDHLGGPPRLVLCESSCSAKGR